MGQERLLGGLFLAAQLGNESEWVKLWEECEDRAAAVAARDGEGQTLLMAAAKGGRASIMNDLLRAGADVNAGTPTGFLVIHAAAADGASLEAFSLLVGHGADIDARCPRGHTALSWLLAGNASQETEVLAVCKLLLAAGSDLEAADEQGYTPFLHACGSGWVEVAHFLLDEGADPAALGRCSDGCSLNAAWMIDRACLNGHVPDEAGRRYRELKARIAAGRLLAA